METYYQPEDLITALTAALKTGNWTLIDLVLRELKLAEDADNKCDAAVCIDASALKHWETLKKLLTEHHEVKVQIAQEALEQVLLMNEGKEILSMLLDAYKRDTPEDEFKQCLKCLAEQCVDTDRTDYMEIILNSGLCPSTINCRDCRPGTNMYQFMQEKGAHVLPY
jgi:hypothetical protein